MLFILLFPGVLSFFSFLDMMHRLNVTFFNLVSLASHLEIVNGVWLQFHKPVQPSSVIKEKDWVVGSSRFKSQQLLVLGGKKLYFQHVTMTFMQWLAEVALDLWIIWWMFCIQFWLVFTCLRSILVLWFVNHMVHVRLRRALLE